MEREVGGGIGMGKTCKLKDVSFQCMIKKKINKLKKKKKKRRWEARFGLCAIVKKKKKRIKLDIIKTEN